jgi:lactoylglutathione lyase
MLRPKALDHVGLLVTDMDRSLFFYTEVLGLELLRRSDRGAGGASSAVLKVGNQEINVLHCLDLMVASRGEPQGIDHFCLTVASATIDDLVSALKQANIGIISGPAERRDGKSVFVIDPDGIRVELLVKT